MLFQTTLVDTTFSFCAQFSGTEMVASIDNARYQLLACLEKLHFLDSLNFMPMSLKIMLKSFDLTCKRGYYPNFFNTSKNLDYVALIPDPNTVGQT